MNKTRNKPSFVGMTMLVVGAALLRLLPHLPANFTPVGAMGVYAGAMLPWPWAVGVSLAGLFLSDVVIGFYHPVAMLFVYAGLAANVGIGWWFKALPLDGGGLGGGDGSHGEITPTAKTKDLLRKSKFLRLPHRGGGYLSFALTSALLGAFAFFVLSNFGVWLSGELYPLNPHGLAACYIAALPFFGNTLASQTLFSLVLLGLHYVLRLTSLRESRKAS